MKYLAKTKNILKRHLFLPGLLSRGIFPLLLQLLLAAEQNTAEQNTADQTRL
jgi:hypothetical protein